MEQLLLGVDAELDLLDEAVVLRVDRVVAQVELGELLVAEEGLREVRRARVERVAREAEGPEARRLRDERAELRRERVVERVRLEREALERARVVLDEDAAELAQPPSAARLSGKSSPASVSELWLKRIAWRRFGIWRRWFR